MCPSSHNEEHDSFFVSQRGTNIIHHSELFGCQWGTPERRDTRGKIFLCKLPYVTNNGYYVNHVYQVSKTWGRHQSSFKWHRKKGMFIHSKILWATQLTASTLHFVFLFQRKVLCSRCQMREVVQWLDGWESLIWSRHLIWLCCVTYQKWLPVKNVCACQE